MTAQEFIQRCWKDGYCLKASAVRYTELHHKDVYTEEDCREAYRMAERCEAKWGKQGKSEYSKILQNEYGAKYE